MAVPLVRHCRPEGVVGASALRVAVGISQLIGVPTVSTATTPSTAPAPGALTTAEIANYLGVHPETVRLYIKTQGLPAHRLQRKWRFVRAEVDAWLEERRSDRPTPPSTPEDDYRAAVRRLVDQAPPLTAAQADRIAAVLRGGR